MRPKPHMVEAGLNEKTLRAPSALLLLAEGRALFEIGFGLAVAPALRQAPKGDGHTVLVLPGFMASDSSTAHLRDVMKKLGHNAIGWDMGRNLGGVARMRQTLKDKLAKLHQQSGRTISLVGWSLGGVLARDLALEMPGHVRQVITLGSPFNGDIGANNVKRLYEALSKEQIPTRASPETLARLAGDLGVPATAIYSRTDGVVNWRTCLLNPNHHAENIEIVGASHMGLGFHPAALWATADRLAQPEANREKFRRRGPFAGAFGAVG
jgi:pimeloyl-ACP methyl ester carboxylesterase